MPAVFGNFPEAATPKLALQRPRLRWLHLAATLRPGNVLFRAHGYVFVGRQFSTVLVHFFTSYK